MIIQNKKRGGCFTDALLFSEILREMADRFRDSLSAAVK